MTEGKDRPTPPPGLVRAVRDLFDERAEPPAERAEAPAPVSDVAAAELEAMAEAAAGVADAIDALVDAKGSDRIAAAERLRPPMDSARTLDSVRARVGDADRPPEEIARAAADALARDISMGARRACLDILVALGDGALPVLREMVEDSRWFVVRNGVAVFGEIGGGTAVEHLTATLGHEDARVRKETTKALAHIGGEDAGSLLLGMIEDTDPEVRKAAAMALGHLKVERAVKPLLERLEEEKDEDVLVTVIRAIGSIGDPVAVPMLEKRVSGGFLRAPSKPQRIAGLRALGAIGTPHARSLLEEALDDRDPDIQAAAEAGLAG